MAEYGTGHRRLPPARLSANEFRQLDAILGPEYKTESATLSWDFFRADRTNSSDSLEEVLNEVQDKKGVREFEVVAEDEKTRITVTAGDKGCRVDFEASEDELGDVLRKVHQIEGVFREHRRVTRLLPDFPAAFRRPALEVGQPSITVHLSTEEIIQGVVTRWLAMVLGLPISFGAGVLTGWLAF